MPHHKDHLRPLHDNAVVEEEEEAMHGHQEEAVGVVGEAEGEDEEGLVLNKEPSPQHQAHLRRQICLAEAPLVAA